MSAVLIARTYDEARVVLERYPVLAADVPTVLTLRSWKWTTAGMDDVDRVYVAVDREARSFHSGDATNLRKMIRVMQRVMLRNGHAGPILEVMPERWIAG